MKEIVLTKGYVTKVDDDDFEWLSQWSWFAWWCKREYRARRTDRSTGKTRHILMSREILHAPQNFLVDHINGDTLDNRKENLRLATPQQNCFNQKIKINNSSGYKGVSWRKDRQMWVAYIFVNKKSIHLGFFDRIEDAALAYNKAAAENYGEFAYLNTIPMLTEREL